MGAWVRALWEGEAIGKSGWFRLPSDFDRRRSAMTRSGELCQPAVDFVGDVPKVLTTGFDSRKDGSGGEYCGGGSSGGTVTFEAASSFDSGLIGKGMGFGVVSAIGRTRGTALPKRGDAIDLGELSFSVSFSFSFPFPPPPSMSPNRVICDNGIVRREPGRGRWDGALVTPAGAKKELVIRETKSEKLRFNRTERYRGLQEAESRRAASRSLTNGRPHRQRIQP